MTSKKLNNVFVSIFTVVVLVIGVYSQNAQPPQAAPQAEAQPQTPPQNIIRRQASNRLFHSPECSDQIQRFCPRAKKIELNDLAVLQCIHNEVQDLSSIDIECQHVKNARNYDFFLF